MRVLAAAADLRDALDGFEPGGRVAYVYHPLRYAWDAHARFVRAYGQDAPPRRRALFVGMNPGAWGATQTGVPFGDAPTTRDWMGITGRVAPPARVHPKRPVLGFDAKRRDGSGAKFYGWARARCGTAERFFREFYVINECPLVFFDAEGKNVTPPQLPKARARRCGPRATRTSWRWCARCSPSECCRWAPTPRSACVTSWRARGSTRRCGGCCIRARRILGTTSDGARTCRFWDDLLSSHASFHIFPPARKPRQDAKDAKTPTRRWSKLASRRHTND